MNRLDTASLRDATGFDDGARQLIMQVAEHEGSITPNQLLSTLWRDRFGSLADYLNGVETAHGYEARWQCESALRSVEEEESFHWQNDEQARARALLLAMPEHDFMLAFEEIALKARRADEISRRVNEICKSRCVPYRVDEKRGFEWVGDAEVQRELVAPALAAINDPRFAGGVRSEFQDARTHLREGTASGRKKAVHDAGCAVESAMKVALEANGIAFNPNDNAKTLLEGVGDVAGEHRNCA